MTATVVGGRHDRTKSNGIHYTPPDLASYVAERLVALTDHGGRPVRILDPACGDGELLLAAGEAFARQGVKVDLVGLDSDVDALTAARDRLEAASLGEGVFDLRAADFLNATTRDEPTLFSLDADRASGVVLDAQFDVVIANPPYVRTQVLGADRARELARTFGLDGRVDLYQVFVVAMTRALREGGSLGIITSNRFLTIKTGVTLRSFFASNYVLDEVVDLGDTKLFQAAVLPALVFGHRARDGSTTVRLTSIYEATVSDADAESVKDCLAALRREGRGTYKVDGKQFTVSRGLLPLGDHGSKPWVYADEHQSVLAQIDEHTALRFQDVGKIRVGIKTTADAVFLRDDWDKLETELQPETDLLLPLLTHETADRWRVKPSTKRVLYPYNVSALRRTPLKLDEWPQTRRYLESHRERLAGRKYVIDGGRQWWEIWVPQQPGAWSSPKIVFPDISERAKFHIDYSGAVVNGDCYWLKLDSVNERLALLILAVGNSSLAEYYYDARFGNKLYAGRRRFITQYVSEFPLPEPSSGVAAEIADHVSALLAGDDTLAVSERETEIDRLVWLAFGFPEPVG